MSFIILYNTTMDEPILEPIWRFWRFLRARKLLPKCEVLLDYGSGPKSPFLKFSKGYYKKAYVIEPLVGKKSYPKNNSVDVVTALAVIEHIEDPLKVLKKLRVVLKPGGKIIITTPSPLNWSLLEILSTLGLQSRREIVEHESYFFKKSLIKLLTKAGFKNIKHEYFEFWLNNLVTATK